MLFLAIETSCDETSAAVVSASGGKDKIQILSNIVATQTEFHQKYGGIVPEIASRKHIELINPVIQQALDNAGVSFKKLDAVAVTYGPGLVGSLLVGLCAAKAIAWSCKIPLIGINHLEGHIYANFINSKSEIPNPKWFDRLTIPTIPSSVEGQIRNPKFQIPKFPFVCLIVSGGHTLIVHAKKHGVYETLGRTRDDAAGEAYDKVARVLGLGYPGGPIIDKLAQEGNPHAIEFKRPMLARRSLGVGGLEDGYDFSFSGIKTAVVNLMTRNSKPETRDLAASFQAAVVEVLVEKTLCSAKNKKVKTICLAGGVSANSGLRSRIQERSQQEKLKFYLPPLELCTDNAAMIGLAAYYKFKKKDFANLSLKPTTNLKI